MVISLVNHVKEAERLAAGFQATLESLCVVPCRVVHAQFAGGTFRRFEVAIAGNGLRCRHEDRVGYSFLAEA
jgi:hypothetical protein